MRGKEKGGETRRELAEDLKEVWKREGRLQGRKGEKYTKVKGADITVCLQ